MTAQELDELTGDFGLNNKQLGEKISDEHMNDIQLLSWKEVGRRLPGIFYLDINDIDEDGSDQQDKRQKLLRKWRETNGIKATYSALITAMLKAQKRDEAEKICELLGGQRKYGKLDTSNL